MIPKKILKKSAKDGKVSSLILMKNRALLYHVESKVEKIVTNIIQTRILKFRKIQKKEVIGPY